MARLSFKNSVETLIKGRVTGLEYKFALTRKFSRGRSPRRRPPPRAGARAAYSVASILSTRLLIRTALNYFPRLPPQIILSVSWDLGRMEEGAVLKEGGVAARRSSHTHARAHIHILLPHLSSAFHRGI